MFQYAAMRWYMKEYNEEILKLSFDSVVKAGFTNDLNNFNVIEYINDRYIEMNVIQRSLLVFMQMVEKTLSILYKNNRSIYNKISNKFEKSMKSILMKNGIYYIYQGYEKLSPSKSKNKIFIGNFESPKYFDDIRDTILKEFTPKYGKLKKNLELYEEIESSESVCVTIRRGDFLSEKNKKGHYVCKEDYFERAIIQMKINVKNAKFFVFSDDIEWVKNNMKFPEGTKFEDGTDPVWEKLRLMYECKHFIISNSTFSWWAQYLSRNEQKTVIAPSRWKNTWQNSDIYMDNWILIEP